MSAFLGLGSKVNIMYPTFIKKLGLVIKSINISIQKIDDTIFKTYKIVVAVFSVINCINKIRFFKKIFLVANISLDVIFKILFLTLNGANIDFPKKKL